MFCMFSLLDPVLVLFGLTGVHSRHKTPYAYLTTSVKGEQKVDEKVRQSTRVKKALPSFVIVKFLFFLLEDLSQSTVCNVFPGDQFNY